MVVSGRTKRRCSYSKVLKCTRMTGTEWQNTSEAGRRTSASSTSSDSQSKIPTSTTAAPEGEVTSDPSSTSPSPSHRSETRSCRPLRSWRPSSIHVLLAALSQLHLVLTRHHHSFVFIYLLQLFTLYVYFLYKYNDKEMYLGSCKATLKNLRALKTSQRH